MCRRKIISEKGKEPVQGGTRAISIDTHTRCTQQGDLCCLFVAVNFRLLLWFLQDGQQSDSTASVCTKPV